MFYKFVLGSHMSSRLWSRWSVLHSREPQRLVLFLSWLHDINLTYMWKWCVCNCTRIEAHAHPPLIIYFLQCMPMRQCFDANPMPIYLTSGSSSTVRLDVYNLIWSLTMSMTFCLAFSPKLSPIWSLCGRGIVIVKELGLGGFESS